MESNQELTMAEVVKITGLSNDLIRVYEEEFNIQVRRTKPNGGHRRFSNENVQQLLAIKKKIQDQNWSYDQVRDWLNGAVQPFEDTQVKSNLEKEVEELKGKVDALIELNRNLVDRLDHVMLSQSEQEERIRARDEQVMLFLREAAAMREEKKKGFWNFLKRK